MKCNRRFVFFYLIFLLCSCKKEGAAPGAGVAETVTVFTDYKKAAAAIMELYSRQVDFSGLDGNPITGARGAQPTWESWTDFGDAFPSDNSSLAIVQRTGWSFDSWAPDWNKSYAYIHDLNAFMLKDSLSVALTQTDRSQLLAEARFLRANFYFELVKHMGGVPLVLDTSANKLPRAKEAAVYDFIISEAEAIKDKLITYTFLSDKYRATKAAALALESRAALYAASMSKYSVLRPGVALPGREIGFSPAQASAYYSQSLKASQAIINSGDYALYNQLKDPAENFSMLFLDRQSRETIFAEDFFVNNSFKTHDFTIKNQPWSLSEEANDGGRINPSLNLVEQFEKTDNTFAALPTVTATGSLIFYNNAADIFAGRDPRLAGTVILPGSSFRTVSQLVDIWAGYQLQDGSVITSDESGNKKPLTAGGTPVQVVGKDGPVNGLQYRTQTGFYLRKYLDPNRGAGTKGEGSIVSYIRYRLGEILLNAAEASYELGDPGTAASYINLVRARAGLIIPLSQGQITFDRIVHERRVELAFEGHFLFDMKRWGLATKVWDGQPTSMADLKNNIGSAAKRNTQPWGLWPYKIYNPGGLNNGKWIFKEIRPQAVTGSNLFLPGNYYAAIPAGALSDNPLLVKQPNQ